MRKQRTSKNQKLKADAGGVLSFPAVLGLVKAAKARGERIVTTNGNFDILHVGHVRNLAFAKRQGDILIVGVNSDASVRRSKGAGRPINTARERAEVVAALRFVDAVFIYNDTLPTQWLKTLKPHVHVKGADRTMNQIPERTVVESGGGIVVRAPYLKNKSTTGIIAKIRRSKL